MLSNSISEKIFHLRLDQAHHHQLEHKSCGQLHHSLIPQRYDEHDLDWRNPPRTQL